VLHDSEGGTPGPGHTRARSERRHTRSPYRRAECDDSPVTSIPSDPGPHLIALADALRDAEQTRNAVVPPSAVLPGMTVEDAYQVQRINIARRLAAGERIAGHKIGLTSLAMQQQLGVDQPDFGVITERMVIANGATLDAHTLIAPRAEAEFAFRLGRDLPVSPTVEALREAIDGVAVSIEIIDSRVADWKITLVDTIADNASSAGIVTSDFSPATPELLASLPDMVISMSKNGARRSAHGAPMALRGDRGVRRPVPPR
jgi:2-keto-4-pentenoate hydratase